MFPALLHAWHAFVCLWPVDLVVAVLALVALALGRPTSVFAKESR